jgi:hypothetical protein
VHDGHDDEHRAARESADDPQRTDGDARRVGTDTNRWYLIDSRLSQRTLLWYWRQRVGAVEFEDDFDKRVRKFKNEMRYIYGYTDWRFVYGSEAS